MNERRVSLGNRVISLLLALVMVVGMLPSGLLDFDVFAADTFTYTRDFVENTSSDEYLTISEFKSKSLPASATINNTTKNWSKGMKFNSDSASITFNSESNGELKLYFANCHASAQNIIVNGNTVALPNGASESAAVAVTLTVVANTDYVVQRDGKEVSLYYITFTAGSTTEPAATTTSSSGTTTGGYVHNFTDNGKESSFYTFTGDNLATDKGSATVNGTTYSTCFKMNSGATITFTAPSAGTYTMYFDTESAGKTISVNGTISTIPATGVLEVDVPAGAITVKRQSGESFLFHMVYAPTTSHTHTWNEGKVTTAATCTTAGVMTYTCTATDCNETKTETIAALGHSWNDGVQTTAPTCTDEGVKTFTCTVCGATKTEPIAALGHTEETVAGKDATCTETGLTAGTKCSVCGAVIEAQEEIPVSDHSWNDGVQTTAPTCTAEGVKTFTCAVCGATKTEPIAALGHAKGDAVVEEAVDATCTEEGSCVEVVKCTICGEEISRTTETVPATGHNYGAEGTCTNLNNGTVCGAPKPTGNVTITTGKTPSETEFVVATQMSEDLLYIIANGEIGETSRYDDRAVYWNGEAWSEGGTGVLDYTNSADGKYELNNGKKVTFWSWKSSGDNTGYFYYKNGETTYYLNGATVSQTEYTTFTVDFTNKKLYSGDSYFKVEKAGVTFSNTDNNKKAVTQLLTPVLTGSEETHTYQVDLSCDAISLEVGKNPTPTVGVTAVEGETSVDVQAHAITWSVKDGAATDVVTISGGKITGAKEGTTTLIATLSSVTIGGGTATNTGVTVEVPVTVTASTTPASQYIHNFTENGTSSSFYTITGSTSTTKGSTSYDGKDLTTCLKMETGTSISFDADAAGTLTLVFGGSTSASGKSVKIDGTSYAANSNGIVTVVLAAGEHTITKDDGINLFYMVYAEDSSTVVYSLSDLTFNPSAIKVGESTIVSSNGVASDGTSHIYTIVYTVDDTNKATVNGTTITGEAAGEVTVTAKLTHVDGTELTSPATKTGTLTISAATVTSGTLTNDAVSVVQGTAVDLSALPIVLTFSDGSTQNVNLKDSRFTLDPDITSIVNTVGTYTVKVYCNDVEVDTLTVTVTAPVTETAAVTYVLDTDGIDADAEYIIVDYLDGTPYAFGHSGSTTEKAFAVTVNGNKVTIDEKNLSGALWKFTAQTTANYYNINSGNYYIKDGGNTLLSTDSTKTVQVVASDSVSGGYLVNLGSASKPQYMYIASASDWKRNSGDEHVVYLYKKTESSDSITIEEVPTLQIGGTASHTLNITEVKYGGSVIAAGNYTVEWTSQNTVVATVNEGVVYATGEGTTQLVATLKKVNGENVTKEVIGSVTVAVQIPSIELGDNQTLFVDDTLTLTPEVELGGATPESYTIEWTSSNPDMVKVDENGMITAKAATGETPVTIVARLKSVNGHDEVYDQNYYDTIEVTVDTVRIVSGQLSSNTVTVAVTDNTEEGAAAVQDAVKDIILTLTKNNGETVTVDHATLFENVDLTVVDTTTPGTYNVSVSYEDPDGYIFAGIVSVMVINPDLMDKEGIITVETNVTYEIDKDGIDAGEEYVIVRQNADGEWVALMNPDATGTSGAKGSSQVVTRSDDGNTITIAQNANLVRWLFAGPGSSTKGDYKYTTFSSISNNSRYLYLNGENILRDESGQVYTYLVDKDKGTYYIAHKSFSSNKSQPLTLEGNSWTRGDSKTDPSNTSDYVYLYKKVGTGTNIGVGFSVSPTEKTIATGTSFTVPEAGISVQVGEDWASSYKIEWSTSDADIATVDSNGKITGVSAGTATITAKLVEANGSQVINNKTNTVGLENTITVKVLNDTVEYVVLGSPLTVPLGGEPDFSKVSLLLDSALADDMTVSSDELVIKYIDAVADGFDTKTAGATCSVDVYYNNEKVGVVVLNVANNAYDGLDEATSYPEYPNTGAVRMDKTATGINFNATGVAKIELNAAGVSSRNPVDVILIVDVSNSMAWTEGTNTYSSSDNKLKDAMAAATDFAKILFEGNVDDSETNNTITFVTFGGHDKEVGGDGYTDAMMTVFVGEDSLTAVSTSFAGTKFTGSKNLTIAGVDGKALNNTSDPNRGNTNYDLGFAQAMDAINQLKIAKAGSVEDYDAGNREVHVVFMTDGAPSHYNSRRFKNSNSSGGFSEFNSDLNNDGEVNDTDWLKFIQQYNDKATELYSMVDDFHIVGFDLAHGGFGDYTWSEAELGRVLGGLVKNKALEYYLASDTELLKTFFNNLGHALAYAGTQALVTDIVSENFVLKTEPFSDGTNTINPTIEIVERRLVVASDIGSTLNIEGVGSVVVTGEHVGMHVVGGEKILATVTFDTTDPNNKKAFSTALDDSKDIWDDETDIITGKYFTYAFGTKTFEWKIGNIEDTEIALTYYGFLEDYIKGDAAHGVYPTNERATLKYINTDNQVVTREYPVPQVAFGSAVVNVRFFLVDKDGNFVNRAGATFTNPANRIFLVNSAAYQFNLNTNLDSLVPGTFTTEDAFFNAGLSSQYTLYDDVTINVTNSTSAATKPGSAVIASGKDKDKTDALVEFIDVYGDGSYIQTTINIPVILVDLGESTQKMSDSHVVIDFSGSVKWNALSQTEEGYIGWKDETTNLVYTIELCGFAKYNPNADLKDYILESTWDTTFDADYGTYEVVYTGEGENKKATNEIKFTPKAMLSGTDHVFAVFKFGYKDADSNQATMNYHYMYKLISVVPATVVHYETTDNMKDAFNTQNVVQTITKTENGATTTETKNCNWSKVEGGFGIQTNDNGHYGYDDNYKSYVNFAGNSYLSVENLGQKAGPHPSVKFTFTGTGIDIISKTGKDQGLIRMTLTGKNTGMKKAAMVINKGVDELYQIPVLSVEGLPYDTYEAEIVVYNKSSAYGGQFFFDAIKVYGSAQESQVIGSTAAGNTTVGSLYQAAGESSPQIIEIRDILLDNNDFGNISASGIEGAAVYIDGDQSLGEGSSNFNDYDKIGPNNEVYLSNNQAVAFKLKVNDVTKLPESLDIGLKSVNGSVNATVYVITGTGDNTKTYSYTRTVGSATAMFYDLLTTNDPVTGEAVSNTVSDFLGNNQEFTVVIANKDTNETILSVTDLKVGYGPAKGKVDTVVDIDVDTNAGDALAYTADVESVSIANMDTTTDPDTAIAYAMYTTTIVVVTGQDAQSIKIVDGDGNKLPVSATFVDSDNGARRWRVLVRFDEVGKKEYTVSAIGSDGNADAEKKIVVNVRLFEGTITNTTN